MFDFFSFGIYNDKNAIITLLGIIYGIYVYIFIQIEWKMKALCQNQD